MTDRTLVAWLTEALAPPDMADVAAQVRADPELAARVALLASRLRPEPAPARFRVPPPGIPGGRRPVGVQLSVGALDDGTVPPLGGFAVRIDPLPDPEQRVVVVLRQVDGAWRAVFPAAPGDEVSLAALPEAADGGRMLDLIAGPEAGSQRWAVALPTAEIGPAWADPDPWSRLRRALAEGSCPVTAVRVEVAGARTP